jgi:hypothetical protein
MQDLIPITQSSLRNAILEDLRYAYSKPNSTCTFIAP